MLTTFCWGLLPVLILMSILWVTSIPLRNVSIVDLFWGAGFVMLAWFYAWPSAVLTRQWLVLALVTIWGLRLSIYLAWRNYGKGEDFRYREFRRKAGVDRYWWYSFFQVFLLQGVLMWLISAPLLGALGGPVRELGWLDALAVVLWLVGFVFEAGSDLQLARFKSDPANRGKLLSSGFWRYTRHPNYFGDAAVWWGFSLFSAAAGSYLPILGGVLMTLLIVKVSGVALLEGSLSRQKPGYTEYSRRTSAFIPWFPRKE